MFNILVYTDLDTAVPKEWIDSDPHMITGNAEQVRPPSSRPFSPRSLTYAQVKLRSFSTNIHKVEALVAYRLGADAL